MQKTTKEIKYIDKNLREITGMSEWQKIEGREIYNGQKSNK